jgi:hypothetical protein
MYFMNILTNTRRARNTKNKLLLAFLWILLIVLFAAIISDETPQSPEATEDTVIIKDSKEISIIWITEDGEILPPIKINETTVRRILMDRRQIYKPIPKEK